MLWVESNESCIHSEKQMLLPFYYQLYSIEITKLLSWEINYEGECIKNMSWVESYKNCIKSKIKLLSPWCYERFSMELTNK